MIKLACKLNYYLTFYKIYFLKRLRKRFRVDKMLNNSQNGYIL